MKAKLQETNEIYRSEPYFLEVLPKGIDKAQTLAVLLDKLGLTKEEVIACGDGFNDLSMVKFAGLGVAMANAQDIVKENADYITLSNDEDGIAHVIEKFIFS
jgi:Cof subfamily protein (haloacid dehalogenase superfamily)